ncbi:cation diffusion facilitator family transporter [Actinocrispum wychmicini]|uniref:Cobalt-zinc-cadmium efflux system protein n=1 Tax=Actinocrispum wychmicini TaxID=1213861 RepID=A0A4R2K2S6_9PSEU|nr:cation diffusion facilitator family transporter [Actinocrispum wychmicini]TCO60605.1 cobalt-zinc-cadmium efflux system protein [Actinocrispum wychmicini]
MTREIQRRRLALVLCISAGVIAIEVVGGLWTGSLALLADAGHLAVDSLGVLMALIAVVLAGRPATSRYTFGWQRAEMLAATINGVLVFGIGITILVKAAQRFVEPPEVASGGMLVVALIASAGMTTSVFLLRGAKGQSLNVRAAFLEVLSDALAAITTAVASLVIMFTGFQRADAIASALIGLAILPRAWVLLREAVNVLLEAVPKGLDLAEVRRALTTEPGVRDVHDLHVWTITSGTPVMTAHVVAGADDGLLDRLTTAVADRFGIAHASFHIESGRRPACPQHQ